MSLKTVLPWLLTIAAVGGAGGLYVSNQKLNSQVALLQVDSQELQQLKAASETNAASSQGLNDELARLRKDNEDLLRLRNEARQLRLEKQQLAAQLQTAQSQVQAAAAAGTRVWNAQSGTIVTTVSGTQGVVKPMSLVNTSAITPEQVAINLCINNLRQIDGAKQQWAMENNKPANTLVSAVNITAYLPGNTLPVCPSGGSYTLNAIGTAPACSVPGHQLQPAK